MKWDTVCFPPPEGYEIQTKSIVMPSGYRKGVPRLHYRWKHMRSGRVGCWAVNRDNVLTMAEGDEQAARTRTIKCITCQGEFTTPDYPRIRMCSRCKE